MVRKVRKGTRQEAEWTFVTDLRALRKSVRRFYQLAEERPEAVFAYIESLPDNWDTTMADDLREVLLKAVQIATKATARRA